MGERGRPNGSNGFLAVQFIEAIPGSGGIVTTIARRVGCSWHTAKKYCTRFATVRRAYEDEVNSIGDLAQSVVIGNINQAIKALKAKQDGEETGQVDSSDAKWYLTRKVPGFEDKNKIGVELDGSVTVNFTSNVNDAKL